MLLVNLSSPCEAHHTVTTQEERELALCKTIIGSEARNSIGETKNKRMKWWLGMENRRAFHSSPLTVKEAVVFEAAPAEECVEGVQRLLPLHRLGIGAVDVGCALWGERIGV